MTQDIDILSTNAEKLAEDIRAHLHGRLQIAVGIRSVQGGVGFRIYQVQKPKNRHLVDVRSIEALPATQRLGEILVLTPVELISSKVIGMVSRPKTAKGFTDAADLRRLLLTFPELKTEEGPVADRLQTDESALAAWRELVAQEILPEDDEAGY
jgi:hypothetical protein